MKYIRQKHRNGCGIASLAMLTNSSYREVLHKLYPCRLRGNPVPALMGAQGLGTALRRLGLKGSVIDPAKLRLAESIDPLLIWLSPRLDSNVAHLAVWDPSTRQVLDPYDGPKDQLQSYEQRSFAYVKVVTRKMHSKIKS